jgi:hypothetical protein
VNRFQRRLFRTFLETGGERFDSFAEQVEGAIPVLSPKTRSAVEAAWRAAEPTDDRQLARMLAEMEGASVSPSTIRQRVSRGMRALEQVIRARGGGHPADP